MEAVIFITFFVVFTLLLLAGRDYFPLFGDQRDEYSRYELFSFQGILTSQWHEIFSAPAAFLAFALFAGFGWLWTLMGGIIGSPHFTNEPGNYFFHSFILLLLILTFRRNFADIILNKSGNSFLFQMIDSVRAISLGTGASLIAATVTVYGYYHEIFFIFVLINLFFTAFFAILGMSDSYPLKMQYPFVHDENFDDGDSENFTNENFDIDIDDEFK